MKHTHFEELITQAGASIVLSPEERARMRANLREHMARTSVRPIVSPYSSHMFSVLLRRPVAALASVVLVVALTGSGITLAAEWTLPGDTLYPIKVSLVEPARTAFSLSDETRAEWQRTLAERRLDEAALLATQGRLSTTTEAVLVENFEHSVDAATQTSKDYSRTPPETAHSEDFAERLERHERTLQEIDDTRDHPVTGTLRKAIREQVVKVRGNSNSNQSKKSGE